jgi:Mn2+/Fe2+ NRAMP family transporter
MTSFNNRRSDCRVGFGYNVGVGFYITDTTATDRYAYQLRRLNLLSQLIRSYR